MSEIWACIGARIAEPIMRAVGDETVGLVVGTSNCEVGSVLPEEILQQVEPKSGCACASKSLVLLAFAIIGQSGAHECCV